MSEYNELYQAVQPESPQVVPDEVRFVYIPKAQKGTPGLAWFNEEHFTVSDDSEVSLSATVLGNIDKKLDKVTKQPESGHGQVYAIYGDGREDPQTMWDLDDTGTYSNYHIPSSDGRGYLKIKDPVEARNPVNKQFLDEKLKGKLDDLGKTSGVFPAVYVRQQGLVVGHDYGKSIEVHGTPDAYTIPVRDAYGALTSASPSSPKDVVTLEYAESHYLKTQPYTPGDGSHSLIFNEIYTNFAFSRDSNVFGENSMVGLWGVKYTAIDTTENSLTVGTISSSPFNVGDRLNIVNDSKYDRSCKFVKYENGKVYVDKLPFSAIVEGDTAFDAYTISSEDNPILGGHYKDGRSNIVDLGKYAFSAGDHNKALNYATFLGGAYNKAYGEYGTAFGRDNEVGYCGFAAGRGNVDNGAHYATMLGKSHILSKNADNSTALGSTHSIDAKGVIAGGQNNIASAGANWSSLFGYNNTLGENAQYGILLGYGNSGTLSTSDMTSPGGVIAIGENNVISRKWGGAIGRSNTIANFATFGMGLGLTSTKNYQSLFGAFNETDGDTYHMDESHAVRITGGGSNANSRMTLETLTSSGDLHLMGKTLRFDGRGSNPVDLTSVNVGKSNKFWKNASYSETGTLLIEQNVIVRGLTSFQGTFVAAKSAQFNDDVAIAKNLDVAGNFTVTGTTTVKDVKNLAVEDLTVTLGKNLQGLGASLAGLVVPDYNGMQQPGGLVFDDTGTAYVGDVSVSSDGVVTQGNAMPLATREPVEMWKENEIPMWNTNSEGFYPSTFTPDSFVQKTTDTENYLLYARKKGTEAVVTYSTAAGNGRIPMYDVGGILRVGAATEDNAAVNLKQLTDGWVKKSTDTSSNNSVYGRLGASDTDIPLKSIATANAIPRYSPSGTLQTATASLDAECVNLAQMKDYAVKQLTAPADGYSVNEQAFVYGYDVSTGTTVGYALNFTGTEPGKYVIPMMDSDGNVFVSSYMWEQCGEDSKQAANIQAVYSIARQLISEQAKIPAPTANPAVGSMLMVDTIDADDNSKYTTKWVRSSLSVLANAVPLYSAGGELTSATPTARSTKYAVVNKEYVSANAVQIKSTSRPAVYGTESDVEKTFRVDVDGENADGYNNTIPIRNNDGILYASNRFLNEDGLDDREVANIGSIKKLAVPLPENQTPTVGKVLEVSSVVDENPVMAWVDKPATLYRWNVQWTDGSTGNIGQVEFICTTNSGEWYDNYAIALPGTFTVRVPNSDMFLYPAKSVNYYSDTEKTITYYSSGSQYGEGGLQTADTDNVLIEDFTVTVTKL